ncbi:MAG: hypothetical protein AB7G21_11730 [Dehalococcoidia bacterium]
MAPLDLRNQACIVGVGTTEFGRILDKSPVRLQVQAFRNALDDCGLDKGEVDGFITAFGSPRGVDFDEFTAHSGVNIRWTNQYWDHGRWGTTSIIAAATAVTSGVANYVLIANTNTVPRGYGKYFSRFSGGRWSEGLRDAGGGQGQLDYHGLDTPGAATSLVARNYMSKYGATDEELGSIAVAFRKHAQLNPNAIMNGKPMTIDDYMESRFISPPFRLFDYCLTNEGSVSIIVTTLERALALKKKPVMISGFQGIHNGRNDFVFFARPGMGVGMQEEYDYVAPPQRVYEMAQVDQKDIDALYVYDAFSTNTWTALERFGFCPAGEAHNFTQDGRIELGGELPINSNGGLMSEGHFSGYNHFVEMTRQLRGECGERQVPNAQALQWITPFGDSMILTKGQ